MNRWAVLLVANILAFLIVFSLAAMHFARIGNEEATERMQACLQVGGTWVFDPEMCIIRGGVVYP